jgi:hypothetical protein
MSSVSSSHNTPKESGQRTTAETIGSEGGEELLDFEIALNIPRRKEKVPSPVSSVVTSIQSLGDSKVPCEDSDYIKITQVVEVSDE